MSTKQADRREIQKAMIAYCLLAIVFGLLLFLLPANPEALRAYNLQSYQYKVVLFSVALPGLLVWFAAFRSYAKLRYYAASLRDTPEGEHYDNLAKGCTWLAWSLPITLMATITVNSLANHGTSFHGAATIIGNYLKLIPPLVAFTLIGNAARGLMQQARLKLSLNGTRTIMFIFAVAGVLYCYLIFRQVNLSGGLGDSHNDFALPIWLLVTSLIVPYLYAWFVGLLAAYEIIVFSTNVSGILYRRALRLVATGLVAVLISSIVTQYIGGLQTAHGYFDLDAKLVLLTVFRLVGGIGFLLLAFGAERLKKIEEL